MNAQRINNSGAPLEDLRAKRAQWLECLYGDDPNSIGYQVYVLLDDFLSWWTINEARRFAPRDGHGKLKGFSLLHGLLDRCFATSQMVAVRRLCDRYDIDRPMVGVWSLKSLLMDLRKHKHAHLLTRELIFAAEGLRDDLEELEREAEEAVRNSAVGPQDELARSRTRHRELDLLTAKTERNRSAQDQVRPQVFQKLEEHLEKACKDICDKVNKFIAHAATQESRDFVHHYSSEVTPNELRKAVFEIKDVFDFVSSEVLPPPSNEGNEVPLGRMTVCTAELFARLEHIDCPLVDAQNVPQVRRAQEEMRKQLSKGKDPVDMLNSLGQS